MDPRLQRRVQRYGGGDEAAADFERSWQRQLKPAHDVLLELAAFTAGERVLDVRCGTGLVTLSIAELVGPSGHVLGVDLSEETIDRARVRARQRGLDRVRFERMGAEELPFPDASFDAVTCALGLMNVPGSEPAAEMARVVRPGGRVIAMCPIFFSLGSPDRLPDAFAAAGLTPLVARRIEAHLEWSSPDEACAARFDGGPVAPAYSRFDDAARVLVQEAFLESIERFRKGTGYELPGEFIIVSGRRPS